MDETVIREVAQLIVEAKGRTAALTGAGISVESGIPDFRSPGGLWERFNPMEYATIDAFESDPGKVWQMLRELSRVVTEARPNPAHRALARLEELDLLSGIVTQNIDNLHQAAGSKNVIEFHGNGARLRCLLCGHMEDARAAEARFATEFPPLCPYCKVALKPDVVLFGEAIPEDAGREAMRLVQRAAVLLVVGTSALVAPASYMPIVARKMGAALVEVNLEDTMLTRDYARYVLRGKAGEILPRLVAAVEAQRSAAGPA
ncbi:MAG: NAD-dependent deacylase [Myxococcales bacterium]|nr:NAD-dependent deacylase [Myxococcales bacterium]